MLKFLANNCILKYPILQTQGQMYVKKHIFLHEDVTSHFKEILPLKDPTTLFPHY